MGEPGSILFVHRWKWQVTPLGRRICQLLPSKRRTPANDCGSWATPMAGTPAQKGYNEAGNTDSGRKTVALASWPTSSARDWKSSASNQHGINARPLNEVARLSSWPTPTLHDAERGGQEKRAMAETRHGSNLQDFALTAHGPTSSGSPARTESKGQLNPAFSLWLMGFSSAWVRAAPSKANRGRGCSGARATRLSRKLPQSSS
jgi:hypothetical protein